MASLFKVNIGTESKANSTSAQLVFLRHASTPACMTNPHQPSAREAHHPSSTHLLRTLARPVSVATGMPTMRAATTSVCSRSHHNFLTYCSPSLYPLGTRRSISTRLACVLGFGAGLFIAFRPSKLLRCTGYTRNSCIRHPAQNSGKNRSLVEPIWDPKHRSELPKSFCLTPVSRLYHGKEKTLKNKHLINFRFAASISLSLSTPVPILWRMHLQAY